MSFQAIIYKAVCIPTGKIYVGQTVKALHTRVLAHSRHARYYANKNRPFYRALLKYGEQQFSWEVLQICSSREETNQAEKDWIARLNTVVPNGYNLSIGGEGGSGVEHWNYGRARSPETILKLKRNTPAPTPEVKQRMAEGLRAYFARGGKPSNYGKKASPELIARRAAGIRRAWARRKGLSLV